MTTLFFTDESADRREDVRTDEATLNGLMRSSSARFMLIRSGRVKIVESKPMMLAWAGWDQVAGSLDDGAEMVFLGTHDGAPCFAAIPAEIPQTIETRPREVKAEGDYVGLFQAGAALPPIEAQFAAQAIHLANWTNRSRRCGRCGSVMKGLDGGHRRQCTQCNWQEFPRTDPVVLALVTMGDRCILARQPKFPPGFYSPLAGFVSPAETLEAAVRREVHEEVGVRVGAVTYIASQPWPFPGSLMLGFHAVALDDKITLDSVELEDAQWFHRSEVDSLRKGERVKDRQLNPPPPGVVARTVIDHWMARPDGMGPDSE
jgi:NAD+ diphosphatase